MTNLWVAWIGFLFGCISGAIPGLFFFNIDWLGGYSSWQRRMIRLAHISFFGIGFLNLSFFLTANFLNLRRALLIPSYLLLITAITMPLVCYLSAYKTFFRHLFFIPASALTAAITIIFWRICIL